VKISAQRARDILHDAQEVCSAKLAAETVSRLAGEITHALHNDNPLVVCVMRGAMVFAGQLLPQLNFPLEVDTVDATRYANSTRGEEIAFRQMPVAEVRGRAVLLVDDILDAGVTLAALRDRLLALGAARVWIAVFALKAVTRSVAVSADFAGVTLPDRYVFGFGMDVYGYWRNLPAVYALNETSMEKDA
jgi:hypoxanthine phosphoribosyltransferase